MFLVVISGIYLFDLTSDNMIFIVDNLAFFLIFLVVKSIEEEESDFSDTLTKLNI